jgi:hypothetical protein
LSWIGRGLFEYKSRFMRHNIIEIALLLSLSTLLVLLNGCGKNIQAKTHIDRERTHKPHETAPLRTEEVSLTPGFKYRLPADWKKTESSDPKKILLKNSSGTGLVSVETLEPDANANLRTLAQSRYPGILFQTFLIEGGTGLFHEISETGKLTGTYALMSPSGHAIFIETKAKSEENGIRDAHRILDSLRAN